MHIADVSHFVRPKTALDREAYDRGTSIYLPDRVIPMLPEMISNGLASLQPDRVRYTKTRVHRVHARRRAASHTELHLGGHQEQPPLHLRGGRRVPGRSRRPGARSSTRQVHDLLGRMHELAMILRERRLRRGALELTMPEVKVDLDTDGRVAGAHLVENTESHQIIEEFMLAANEAVAELLHEAELHFLRRVHQAPDPRKLKALTEFVAELGFKIESLESRFELQKLLADVAGKPEAAGRELRRAAQPATGRLQSRGRRPLRPGQRVLLPLHLADPPLSRPDDPPPARRAVDTARSRATISTSWPCWASIAPTASSGAEAAERELTKVKLLDYLSTRIGDELEAVVTGVESSACSCKASSCRPKAWCTSHRWPTITIASIAPRTRLSGYRSGNRYRLGDSVRVAVARVDVDRRELDLRIVARVAERRPRPPMTKKDRKSKQQRAEARATKKSRTKGKGKSKRRN